jgi:hypothetical protein
MEVIVNKVAESGILTLDLAQYIHKDDIAVFDLKPFLFREMILREKDYRAALPAYDWEQYQGKHVAVTCSVEAIVPVWAYMLAAAYLQPVAASLYYGTADELEKVLIQQRIHGIDVTEYTDKRVVIKGCGDTPIPDAAYLAVTERLRPVVKSLMYGEPCSTVPIYKRSSKPAVPPGTTGITE